MKNNKDFCSSLSQEGTTEEAAFTGRGSCRATGCPLPASQLAGAQSGSFAAAVHKASFSTGALCSAVAQGGTTEATPFTEKEGYGASHTSAFSRTWSRQTSQSSGFALVVAMLVLALLVVAAVGAAMFLQVEVRTGANAKKIAEARQNALFGLEIALGQLQELAGPDQRVTATATLNRNSSANDWSPGVDLQSSPTRHWTGVWDVSKNRNIPDPTKPGRMIPNLGQDASQLDPQPLAWLVSGGWTKGSTSSETNNVVPTTYPARIDDQGKIISSSLSSSQIKDHVVVLGAGSVDLVSDNSAGVVVPKVRIHTDEKVTGAYAYWIADEGVKANFQAGIETEAFKTSFPEAKRDLLKLQAAQSLGIQTMRPPNLPGSPSLWDIGYDPQDPDFARALAVLATPSQSKFLSSEPEFAEVWRKSFHDLSAYSEGLLVDVKKGGLKQDLSVYLQNGEIPGQLEDSDLLYEDRRDLISTDPLATPSNPRSPFRVRYPGFHPTSNDGLPRSGLIRSWAAIDPDNPSVVPRTSTQHGLFPVITRCEWNAWLRVNLDFAPVPPATTTTFPHTLPSDAFELRIHPVITLYNPHNVNLPGQDYDVVINVDPEAKFEIRPSTNVSGGPQEANFAAALGGAANPTMLFRIPAAESALAAGSSKVFTLDLEGVDYTPGMELVNSYLAESNGFGLSATRIINPSGDNQNGYFKVNFSGSPFIVNAEAITTRAFQFGFTFARPSSAVNSILPEKAILRKGNENLQIIQDLKRKRGWLITNDFLTDLRFEWPLTTNSFFQTDHEFLADTRTPIGSFHRRPFVHHSTASTSGPDLGGSLAPTLQFNPRASIEEQIPSITVDHQGSSTFYWGAWRNIEDNTTAWKFRAYAPPILTSVLSGATLESFPYSYQPSPSGPAQDVSAAFSSISSAPLFEFLSPQVPLISLGLLQHADISGHAYQPAYIFGNSWVNSQLAGRDHVTGFFNYDPTNYLSFFNHFSPRPTNSTQDSGNRIYDTSFLANDALWDRFFLSGIDTTIATQPDSLLSNESSLPNSLNRFIKAQDGKDYNSLSNLSSKLNLGAAHLMTKGAFNVNSTSVEAWKALLSSMNGLRVNSDLAAEDEAVFSRLLRPGGGTGGFFDPTSQPAGEEVGAYAGARRLSADEIQLLAEKIVDEVKFRGPFTSLSDFVNRRLVPELSGPPFSETPLSRTGLKGALQAAIDNASGTSGSLHPINNRFYNPSARGSFYTPSKIQVFGPGFFMGAPRSDVNTSDTNLKGHVVPRLAMFGEDWYYSAAGVPGFVTQADILQSLGHLLTVRSDTFLIRAYGEATNTRDPDKVDARAWCEAVVQRVADPVKENPSDAERIWPDDPKNILSDLQNALGRKFQIISFRWLTPEEI